MRLLIAYLAPVYLAFAILYHPDPSQPMLKFTWGLLLLVGLLSSVHWYQPRAQSLPLHCPACTAPNAPERLLCHHCYTELYALDPNGNLVPTSPDNAPKPTPQNVERQGPNLYNLP